MTGEWKFRIDIDDKGSGKEWHKKEWTDNYKEIIVPGSWESQGENTPNPDVDGKKPYDGYAWYQKSVFIPSSMKGIQLYSDMGAIDDFDWTYFNGVLIGKIGEETPHYWETRRYYQIPQELIQYDKPNTITVRVFDGYMAGGIMKGPVRIIDRKIDTYLTSKFDIFSRLDLSGPGLEDVRKSVEEKDYTSAARNLLLYYRNRKTVKFFIDPKKQRKSRGRIASQKELKIARDALKHIFISQPSYPSHNFGKDIDWNTNIYPDNEWLSQLHRMYWWEPMGKAYWHTGDESFAREWVFQFLDWKKKSPPNFKIAWSSLEVGIREHSFPWWYHYFRDSEAFTPEFLLEFLSTAYEHAVRLFPGYTEANNWGLMESEGLAYISITFPEFKEAEQWKKRAFERLSAETDAQIYPDGMHTELTFGYHKGCIKWFLRTANLAELNGMALPEGYREKIEKMYNITAYTVKPDGTTPMFGDSWNESGLDTVREGAEQYKRKDFAYISSLKDKKRRGKKPSVTSVPFPDSGYYIFRSDWNRDAIWLCVKCGPDGKWHCQPDNCSFELFAYGSYLMPDSGCYIYSGDKEEREWFRATEHHQCFTLDNKNSEYKPQLLLWYTSPELTALTVQNQGYPGLAHRRNIFFIKRRVFIIVDEIIGTAAGRKQLHFQFGPPDAVFAKDGSITVKGKDAGRLLFMPVDKDIEATREQGKVAFKYRNKQERSAVAYNLGDKPVFTSLLVPYRGDKPPDCSVSILSNGEGLKYRTGDNEMIFTIMIDNKSYTLRRNLKTGTALLED